MRIIDKRIANKDSFKVVGLEIDWTPNNADPSENEIARLWDEFNERKSEIPNAVQNRTYGLERFQPNAGPAGPLKYLASVEVSHVDSELPKGMIAADIPAATYAVVTYQGVIDGIGKAYDHFYREWEPTMKEYKAAHTLCYEYYDEQYKGNDNSESILEVWFALSKTFQCEIVTKPAYRAIGLKWDGPWSEIRELKSTIHTASERVSELEHAVDPNTQLGLSYHLRPDGFVHYSVYEVTENQEIPEGMIEIRVPEMTYLVTQHHKGENIGHTYDNISAWLANSDYNVYAEPGVKYFDNLPIKHERYPHNRDQNDPHFEILIPVVK